MLFTSAKVCQEVLFSTVFTYIFLLKNLFLLMVVHSLSDLSVVVICSSENEDRAHMAAALDQYRLGTIPPCASPKDIRQYLKTQFKPCSQQRGTFRDQILPWIPAASLDKEG